MLAINLAPASGISIEFHWSLIVVAVIVAGGVLLYRRHQLGGKDSYLEVNEAEFGFGTGKVKLKANIDDLQVGFSFWTELTTRKIGLPFDDDHDVIVEIYDSWFHFFGIARELIKSIPVSKVRNNASTKELVLVSVYILNEELRPHLTRWQAQYRRWWDTALADSANKELTPQQLQRKYPKHDELVADLKAVNNKLVIYAGDLKDMLGI
ncbi:MAG: hypothetical protein NT042_09345 [Sulfuritalea sp.]|jgi:hypothetical protein|nr:hypothetical protein [Sulfuritalea sp.]